MSTEARVVYQHKNFRDCEASMIAAGVRVPSFVKWAAEAERVEAAKVIE